MNNELVWDTSKSRNKRWVTIIKQCVEPQFQPKLLEWAIGISESNKKGLNVIKTVLDLKGMKRFKRDDKEMRTSSMSPTDFNVSKLDANQAREIARKGQI